MAHKRSLLIKPKVFGSKRSGIIHAKGMGFGKRGGGFALKSNYRRSKTRKRYG